MRTLALLFFAVSLSACALPVPEGTELSSFVPERELKAVALAEEAMYNVNRNRYVDAELGFRQALYLFPDLDNLKANLAGVLERTGQYEESETLFRSLLVRYPQSVPYMNGMARVRASIGDFAGARDWYTKAYETAMALGDTTAAGVSARSLSALSFRIADDETALCYAGLAYTLRQTPEELKRYGRLLLAVNRPKATEELVVAYMMRPGVAVVAAGTVTGAKHDPELLHLRSMAAFAQNRFEDAREMQRILVGLPGIDPALLFEMRLVRYLSGRELGEELKAQGAKMEETQSSFFESIVQFVDSNSAAEIFWPPNFVEKTHALADELRLAAVG